MKLKISEIAATIAFLVAAQIPSQSFAEAPARSTAISMSGLDLADPHDAQRGLHRIERAAGEVCGESFSHRFGMTGQAFRACRAETVADVVARMDAPMLVYAYEAQYGAAPVARSVQMAMQ
jgi:UrcA family protein